MKKVIVILFIGLTSCKQAKMSLVGKYDRYWDFEHYSSLQLNPDKSFTLTGQEGLMFFKTEGTWRAEDKYLFLDSYPDNSLNIPSTVISETKVKSDSIQVTVLDDDNNLLPGVTVLAFRNGDTIVADYTRENGRVVFKSQALDSVTFKTYGFSPYTYTGENNKVEIKMGIDELAPFRIENEKWLIKNKSLIDPRFEGEQSKNRYRKKTSR